MNKFYSRRKYSLYPVYQHFPLHRKVCQAHCFTNNRASHHALSWDLQTCTQCGIWGNGAGEDSSYLPQDLIHNDEDYDEDEDDEDEDDEDEDDDNDGYLLQDLIHAVLDPADLSMPPLLPAPSTAPHSL